MTELFKGEQTSGCQEVKENVGGRKVGVTITCNIKNPCGDRDVLYFDNQYQYHGWNVVPWLPMVLLLGEMR